MAGVGLLAALIFASLMRDPLLSGDMIYHLIWGRELAGGTLESFTPGPTPHPLVIAAAAATSVLGTQASYDATWLLFAPCALGAAVAAVFCIGLQLGNGWTATLAAVTLATNPQALRWATVGQYDIAFGALVLWALAAHVARPRHPSLTLALLALAGLMRPEAWVIAGLYWLWAMRSLAWPQRLLSAGIVGFAPACWMAMDAAVMGDFLYSFHYTETASQTLTARYTLAEHVRESVVDLARGTGLLTIPAALLLVVQAGALRRPGMRPVLLLLGLTLAIFALLLLDGMPNERYLIIPAWLLILLAALAATPARGTRNAVVVGAAALLALQAIARWQEPLQVNERFRLNVGAIVDVRRAVERPDVSWMLASCPEVTVTPYSEQLWAYWSGRSLSSIEVDDRPVSRPDVFIAPGSKRAAAWLLTRRDDDSDATFAIPAGMRRGPAAGAWRLYVDPRSRCVAGAVQAAA